MPVISFAMRIVVTDYPSVAHNVDQRIFILWRVIGNSLYLYFLNGAIPEIFLLVIDKLRLHIGYIIPNIKKACKLSGELIDAASQNRNKSITKHRVANNIMSNQNRLEIRFKSSNGKGLRGIFNFLPVTVKTVL